MQPLTSEILRICTVFELGNGTHSESETSFSFTNLYFRIETHVPLKRDGFLFGFYYVSMAIFNGIWPSNRLYNMSLGF